jgi:hypothetical protein
MTQECDPEAYTDLASSHDLAANQDIVLDRVYQISDQRSRDVWSRGAGGVVTPPTPPVALWSVRSCGVGTIPTPLLSYHSI